MPKHAPTRKTYSNIPVRIYTISASVTAAEKLEIEEFCRKMGMTQAELIREGVWGIISERRRDEFKQVGTKGTEQAS